jgi:cyclase
MPFTVGGGIRDIEDIRDLLNAGADKVSINTAAVRSPDLINQASQKFGSQCIVVAIDAKLVDSSWLMAHSKQPRTNSQEPTTKSWQVYINGGRTPVDSDAVSWAKEAATLGAGEILLTSMDYDGTKDGYDLELTKAVTSSLNIPVIASGGAGKLEHFLSVFLEANADAGLAASIFHYGEYSVKDVKKYLREKGVSVRV